jgi:uncharacterized protein
MTRQQSLHSLNLQTLAEGGKRLVESTPLQKLERLAQESIGIKPDSMVNWLAEAELRVGSTGQPDTWLHLQANTAVPMTCQRCMGAMQTPLVIDQWYRFVATEEIAMAEDDASEEDLLVMTPQFDLLALLEDELLMALPLVPMHEVCPVAPLLSAGNLGDDLHDEAKPHPFAALAQLKKK